MRQSEEIEENHEGTETRRIHEVKPILFSWLIFFSTGKIAGQFVHKRRTVR
jgi:hypothetical protein